MNRFERLVHLIVQGMFFTTAGACDYAIKYVVVGWEDSMKHLPRFLFALGCTAFLLVAEEFWVKKPFTEWSVKDATKLLQNSPWSHEVSVGGAMPMEDGSAGGGRRGGGGMGGNNDMGGMATGGTDSAAGRAGGRRGGGCAGDPIEAGSVQRIPGEKGSVAFFFPKTSAITLEDKEVEFVSKVARIEVRRKFKLKDMVVGDKLEL